MSMRLVPRGPAARIAALAALCLSVGGIGSASAEGSGLGPTRTGSVAGRRGPSLIVLVVVDQLGSEVWRRWSSVLDGGLAELARRGAVYPDGVHEQANSATGPGHASIITGAWPSTHGIVSNDWYDPQTGLLTYCVQDPTFGQSPRLLAVPTLGDQLHAATGGRAKVVSVAIKDRVAVLLAGQRPQLSVWFDTRKGALAAGRWYGREAPGWLGLLGARVDPEAARGRVWDRARPELDYARLAHRDDAPWEGDMPGLGKTFPRVLGQAATLEQWRDTYRATPDLLDGIFAVADTAAEQEQLGQDDAPDLLAIGASTLDFVGHFYGPRSQESLDILIRTDRALGQLMQRLEARLGRDRIVYAVTGDHGAAPAPEDSTELGLRAERIGGRPFEDAADTALAKLTAPKAKATKVKWIDAPLMYLEYPDTPGLDRTALRRAAARGLSTLPTVVAAYAREDVALFAEPWRTLFARVLFPGREADVVFLQRPFDILDPRYATGSNHGTPYAYDTHVPILLSGRGVSSGVDLTPVTITRLAPSLAALVGLGPPAAAFDPPLPAVRATR